MTNAPQLNYQFRRSDYGFRNNSGNFAIFAAIRRASSLVSSLAAMSLGLRKGD
jgi:hypothetical protein